MAFVNEFIPEEEKGRFKDISNWKYSGYPIELYKWTIDRERDVFLIRLGGGVHESPHFYALSWRREVIKFRALKNRSGNREIGYVMSWSISNIEIPQNLVSSKDEIIELIKEAIDALGWLYSREYIKAVDIKINAINITIAKKEESNLAFVNEFIPEAEKGRFKDISIWKDPLSGAPIELYKWTIDRERDVFLIPLGSGGPEIPIFFALSWRGEVIKFEAFEKIYGPNRAIEMLWIIANMEIPQNFASSKAESMELIKEAIEAFGLNFSRENIKHVTIVERAKW